MRDEGRFFVECNYACAYPNKSAKQVVAFFNELLVMDSEPDKVP